MSDPEIEKALILAATNRPELEAVLDHYRNNPVKLEAARFLIRNMPYHYSVEEYFLSPDSEKYRPDFSLFKNSEEGKTHCDSLMRQGYRTVQHEIPDITTLDSKDLINNIELAFSAWQKPWAQEVSFHDFCRYILPFRAQMEKAPLIRAEMMERFMIILDSVNASTALEACIALKGHLKSVKRYQDTGI